MADICIKHYNTKHAYIVNYKHSDTICIVHIYVYDIWRLLLMFLYYSFFLINTIYFILLCWSCLTLLDFVIQYKSTKHKPSPAIQCNQSTHTIRNTLIIHSHDTPYITCNKWKIQYNKQLRESIWEAVQLIFVLVHQGIYISWIQVCY